MPEFEFWHGDMRLLEVYRKAYERDKSFTAWLNGYYTNIAYGVVMSNAFAKKGAKQVEYPQWKDTMDKWKTEKVDKEETEKLFRNQLIEQQNWFFNKKN